jgi:hypothetical protein
MMTISLIRSVARCCASNLPLADFEPCREWIQPVKSSANKVASAPVLGVSEAVAVRGRVSSFGVKDG